MANLLLAPHRLSAAQKRSAVTVYLAGPFEDNWRDRALDALMDLPCTIIDPRSDRWAALEMGSAGRRGAYEWQCSQAFEADVVVVWAPVGSHDPTSMLVLGYLGAKRNNAAKGSSVIVGGDGWSGLARLFAQNQRLFPVDGDLAETLRIARLQIESALATKAARP